MSTPESTNRGAQIVVLGSINMDLVIRCSQLPRPGQTIIADSSAEVPGGKGANQAVAAARAGGNVSMIGRVGDDAFSSRLMENLQREQVATDGVLPTTETPSGLAIVAVESSGENSIVAVPGANARLSPADVATFADRIRTADVLMLQLEVPIETVQAAIEVARQAGVTIVLDPAPMPAELDDALLRADLICPNESETEAIVGHPVSSDEEIDRAIASLHARGARQVILTLGSRGAVASDGTTIRRIDPTPIDPVDTTAAGDAFAGALAVRLAEGANLFEAAGFAAVAGALAATRPGAQPGMPTRTEIDQILQSQKS
ncbi:ribokinase [Rosistilla oblonga]|uniref:ribokinase n=1 Tax=Rosistilla oblonga TaxID=2527990 RepID=UPI003A977092